MIGTCTCTYTGTYTYTNGIVYDPLAPSVLDELKRVNQPVSPGRRREWNMAHPPLRRSDMGKRPP